MDSPQTPLASTQPPAPQPAASLSTPELPHAPEKLLTAHATAPHKTSWGAGVGIVIILLVLIIGALYFWGAELAEEGSTGFIAEPDIETSLPQE